MKIVCSQSDLKNNLSLVSRAVPSRPEPAVLGNVLMVATEATQKVSMVAFDGNLGIKTSFNAEVIEEGQITLPAKLFNDIVTRLPEMEITLDLPEDEDDFVVTISSISGKFRLTGIDAEEFPQLPEVDSTQIEDITHKSNSSLVVCMELPVSVLRIGLASCLFAVSSELSKQVLTGVHLKTALGDGDREDVLEFAATDSHRLAVVSINITPDETEDLDAQNLETSRTTTLESNLQLTSSITLPNFAVTIPGKALRELEKIISDATTEERVKIRFDESVMIFEYSDRLLTSAKIPGDYPAYGQLIPRSFIREMIVDRKRLLSSLELVAVLAQKNNLVKFSLNGEREELTVSADAQDIGNAQQSLPAQIIGADIEIAFNIKYLMDGLKAISAPEVKMQLNEGNQPAIFTPLGGLDMIYLVMPVQIRN